MTYRFIARLNGTFILFVYFLISIALLIIFNNYFEDIVTSTPNLDDYPSLTRFIGGDSVLYYKLSIDIITDIFDGYSKGAVAVGSVFSLIGIGIVVEILNLFPLPIQYTWVLFSFLIVYASAAYKNDYYNKNILILSICLSPMVLIYLLTPNKEIFTLCFITLLPRMKSIAGIIFLGILFSIFREAYLIIALVYSLLYRIKSPYLILSALYLYAIFISFIMPESYFQESYIEDSQISGYLTQYAKTLLNEHFFAMFAILIKFVIGVFGPIYSIGKAFEPINIASILYFINSLFIFLGGAYIFLNKKRIFNPVSRQLSHNIYVCILSCSLILSLAPGSPARIIGPISILVIWLLFRRSNEVNNIRIQEQKLFQ